MATVTVVVFSPIFVVMAMLIFLFLSILAHDGFQVFLYLFHHHGLDYHNLSAILHGDIGKGMIAHFDNAAPIIIQVGVWSFLYAAACFIMIVLWAVVFLWRSVFTKK